MRTLETPRLILRPHTMADVDAVYAMNLDPEISRYTHDGGVCTRAEIERRIRDDVLGDYATHGYGRFAVVHKQDDRFIGFCGLKRLVDLDETDLGYRLLRAYWGQGLATEAALAALRFGFEDLALERIVALALADNTASIRVMEKLGMVFRNRFEEDGAQAVRYEIAAADWRRRS